MDYGAQSYKKYMSGNDDGIVEIVREYRIPLIAFVNGYVSDYQCAEDLVEDTFFRLMTRKPHYDARYTFKTWIYTIAKNIALDYLRRQKRYPSYSIEDVSENTLICQKLTEDVVLSQEQSEMIDRAIRSMNPTYQQIIYLRYYENFSNKEISRIMNKNQHAIETALYKAREELKKILKEEKIHEE